MPLLTKLPGAEAQSKAPDVAIVPNDVAVVLGDSKPGIRTPQENGIRISPLVHYVNDRHNRSKMARRPWEQLWLEAHRNYRGLYGPDVQFTATEKSKIFIRVTKTKVNAGYGQLMDVLFADNKFPISIEAERLPEGVVESISIETNPQTASLYDGGSPTQGQPSSATAGLQNGASSTPMPTAPADASPFPKTKHGFKGDGTRAGEELHPAVLAAFTGPLSQNESIHPGPPKSPTAVGLDIANLSAKKMEKKIQDQLRLSEGDKHLRHAAFECVNLGTGCIKGPIIVNKPLENDKGKVKLQKAPGIEAVSIWNIYPDPDARTTKDCDYIVQRHKLNLSQLRSLKTRPGFRKNEINSLIMSGFNYQREWWEPMLQDMPMVQPLEKFEVLEYWGMIDKALAAEFDIEFPEEFKDCDEVPMNVWVSGGYVIRLILNPFNNGQIPYYLIPYELQPYVIWGIGVSETMSDSQTLMNGFMRLAVDNAVLSGNMVFEIDESALVPGQSYDLYPGKFFRRMGGQQGQAIFPHEFPNTAQANMQLYDKARELADEATFPSFAHGNTSVNPSLGRTSSGLSMMMGAASVGIRTCIKNFDDYLLTPLGQAFFEFNKLNSDDEQLKGNFVVVAGGTDSLMRNEVRSQRIVSLIQLGQNPQLAPFFKWPYLIREACSLMDLDADKATNTDEETMRMAEMLKNFQQQPPEQNGQQPQQVPNKAQQQKGTPTNPAQPHQSNPNAGQVSLPGEKQFSASKSAPAQHASPGQGVS